MTKHPQTVEHIFQESAVDEPSVSHVLIEKLKEENGAMLAALWNTLTDTHLMDRRINDLISDLSEWCHGGDVDEAQAIFSRNDHIVGLVIDLIEQHVVIANTPMTEIETAFSQADDTKLKKVLNAIYTKRSDTTDS